MFSTAKASFQPFIEKIKTYFLENERKESDYWALYLEYVLKIREYILSDIENEAYKINYDFTKLAFKYLLTSTLS